MLELISLIYEYRLLREKSDRLCITLGDAELCRMAGLERLLSGEDHPRRDRRRAMARARMRAFVRFTLPNDIGVGEMHDVSGGGARIDASHPPTPGTPVLLAVHVAPAHEFVFPGRVVWRDTGSFGVVFEGVPSRRRLTHPVRAIGRPSVVSLASSTRELVTFDQDDEERTSITEIKCKTPVPVAPAAEQPGRGR